MNPRKRRLVDAAVAILTEVRDQEQQDLEDTPDNIENSVASDDFRNNIDLIDEVVERLERLL